MVAVSVRTSLMTGNTEQRREFHQTMTVRATGPGEKGETAKTVGSGISNMLHRPEIFHIFLRAINIYFDKCDCKKTKRFCRSFVFFFMIYFYISFCPILKRAHT